VATPQELQAAEAAWSKQYDDQMAAQKQQEEQAKQPPSLLQQWTAPVSRITTQMLDGAVSAADRMYNTEGMRKARDVAAGATTLATNIADTGMSLADAAKQNFSDLANPDFHAGTGQPAPVMNAEHPIWDHAKAHILDFRDAVAVQDPTLADYLTQAVAQLAIPFAGYSRALGGLGAFAKMVTANALTDATALQPHDARTADIFALGRHTEGKLGEALRALAPDGSAQNAVINFLADRSNETEAEGRLKNVLDGFGVNLVATPLIHGAAVVLKQGQGALRYMIDNGVRNTISDLMPMGPAPGSMKAQAGKIVRKEK
jgi:hypothetical protein